MFNHGRVEGAVANRHIEFTVGDRDGDSAAPVEQIGNIIDKTALEGVNRDLVGLVGPEAHMDGAFDKMFVRLHVSGFPLTLLPPYAGVSEVTKERFTQLLVEKHPRWMPDA